MDNGSAETAAPRTHQTVRATFVIPVRNDAHALSRCLQSIRREIGASGDQIVVVDNGSIDASAVIARAQGADVLELPGLKVGELRNRGAAAAQGDILAFVDADHEIGAGWIEAASTALGHSHVGAVGCPYSTPASANWVQRAYDALRRQPAGIQPVDWLGAGNLAVRFEAFQQVGGFDTSLEACEDVDFCQRLRAAGFTLLAVPGMTSVHYGDPASLKALFFSELWRGRDNVRVTLRGPLTPTSLPSLIVPIANLAAIIAVLTGLVVIRSASLTGAGLAILAATVALRSVRLLLALRRRTPLDVIRTWLVAGTYEVARALALIARTPHRRARGALAASATR
jgi:GT2 family glycosyltransferase